MILGKTARAFHVAIFCIMGCSIPLLKAEPYKHEISREQQFATALNRQEQIATFRQLIQQDCPAWMRAQIERDFAPFREKGILKSELDRYFENSAYPTVRVKIIQRRAIFENSPFAKPHERIGLMQEAFDELAKLEELEGLDLLIGYSDSSGNHSFPVAICAYAKNNTNCSESILIPDFEALMGHFQIIQDVSNKCKLIKWNEKKSKAVWRGAMTGQLFTLENFLSAPRSRAISLSLMYPKQVDARYNLVSQCDNPEVIKQIYAAYFGESLSLSKQLRYKYQLLIDGNTSAYSRAYWQLFSHSLCFKQESDEFQWYYGLLQPYVHYVPVKHDMSDLIEKIKWAKENDKAAYKIALQAADLAFNNLTYSRILQYLYLVCREYQSLYREE